MRSGISEGLTSGISEGLTSDISEGLTSDISEGLTSGISGGMRSGISEGLTSDISGLVKQCLFSRNSILLGNLERNSSSSTSSVLASGCALAKCVSLSLYFPSIHLISDIVLIPVSNLLSS